MLIRHFKDRLSKPRTKTPEPLGPEQCRHLAKVIAGLVPDWSVELRQDLLGKPIIAILPDDLDDALNATLIVRIADAAFRLEELRGDTCRTLGDHHEWADLVCAVRIRLIWEMQFPRALPGAAMHIEPSASDIFGVGGETLISMEGVARHETLPT